MGSLATWPENMKLGTNNFNKKNVSLQSTVAQLFSLFVTSKIKTATKSKTNKTTVQFKLQIHEIG